MTQRYRGLGWSLGLAVVLLLLAAAPASAARRPPCELVKLTLEVVPGGTMMIKQTYIFTAGHPDLPEDLDVWVPVVRRQGLLYRDMVLQATRVQALNGAPVQHRISRTPNGIWFTVDEMVRNFDYGPGFHLMTTLDRPFSGGEFASSFFGKDNPRGGVAKIEVEILWNGPLRALQEVRLDLRNRGDDAELKLVEREEGRVLYRAVERDMRLPVEINVRSLALAESIAPDRGGTGAMISRLWSNLWFFLSFGFLGALAALAWALAREGGRGFGHHPSRTRPPSGMEPGAAAVLLYGGISSRFFTSAVLWFAHRGKVHLEYRAEAAEPLTGMSISKRMDPDAAFKDYERLLWNNLLFEGVDSNSLHRLRAELNRRARRHRLRRQLVGYFPVREPLLKPQAREWWLWSKPYQVAGALVFALAVVVMFGWVGLLLPELAKTDWLFTWPLMAGGGVLFMAQAQWQRQKPHKEDSELLGFASFLAKESRTMRDLRGNVSAFSLLLPFAVATGNERNLIDAYTMDQRVVTMPPWFMVYGTGGDQIHANIFRELMGDFIEGMLDSF